MIVKKIYLNLFIERIGKGFNMNVLDIINHKRLGKILKEQEIEYIIKEYTNGNIPDYQMSSFLMAVLLKGMTEHEVIVFTKYMLESGDRIDLDSLTHVVDKHSTGGVGDKTTLIVGAIVAACGCRVAKMSGRGLGHTGGTIDKLESIPGMKVHLSENEFLKQVQDIGIAIVSQTSNLVPADKKIYALRDVTGTVESMALIASSIMSKKIASGSKNLVIDVKIGSGALIKTKKEARELAKLMIKIGKSYGIRVICLLTNMDTPLGNCIGNSLEVEEAIGVLKNKIDGPLRDLCIEIASYMVSLGQDIPYEEARVKVIMNLMNGNAYRKFVSFVKAQKGSLIFLPKSKYVYEIKSDRNGYINKIDALSLGKISMELGAGRVKINDKIDYGAGIVLNQQLGQYVHKGDILMYLHTSKKIDNLELGLDSFVIEKRKKVNTDIIYDVMK